MSLFNKPDTKGDVRMLRATDDFERDRGFLRSQICHLTVAMKRSGFLGAQDKARLCHCLDLLKVITAKYRQTQRRLGYGTPRPLPPNTY